MKLLLASLLILSLLLGNVGCSSPASVSEVPEDDSDTAETASEASTFEPAAGTSEAGQVVETPPAPAEGFSQSLRYVKMVDEAAAWAAAPGAAYRSTDGGLHWFAFQFGSEEAISEALYAADANHAWVAERPDPDEWHRVAVWRTADGGQSWLPVTLHVPTVVDQVAMDFDSEQDGWLLTSSGPAAGLMEKSLFHTTDGGVSWQLVVCGCSGDEFVPTTGWMYGGLYTTGMAFRDATTGWVTGQYHGGDPLQVLRTDDGGLTWTTEELPLPAAMQTISYGNGISPIFFGQERDEGLLPVHYRADEDHRIVFYSTEDGGETWQILGELDSDGCSTGGGLECLVAADDLSHFWLPFRDGRLRLTSDGGRTWEEVQLDWPLAALSFGSAAHGLGLAQDGKEQILVRTADGGRTWVPTAAPVDQ